MVFQIVDDILDITDTTEQLGKPAGHDMVEGVYTLPVLRTLAMDGSARAGRLLGRPLESPRGTRRWPSPTKASRAPWPPPASTSPPPRRRAARSQPAWPPTPSTYSPSIYPFLYVHLDPQCGSTLSRTGQRFLALVGVVDDRRWVAVGRAVRGRAARPRRDLGELGHPAPHVVAVGVEPAALGRPG